MLTCGPAAPTAQIHPDIAMRVVTVVSGPHHLMETIASYPAVPISTAEIPAAQGDLPAKLKLTERRIRSTYKLRYEKEITIAMRF
jgi:hypothetical protein